MNTPAVLIMAAGRGTRMRSKLPKVLHPLCGRPMLLWTVHAAREAGARADRRRARRGSRPGARARCRPTSRSRSRTRPPGTGDAVAQARDALAGCEHVIVLSGDHPLLDGSFITALAERHVSSGAAATVTTRELEDPGQYGRVVRAPGREHRAHRRDQEPRATPRPEEIAIKEINAGTYAFAVEPLFEALAGVRADNSQGEYYLGDVLPLLRAAGHGVVAHLTEDEAVGLGVNTRADLAVVEAAARARLLEQHMLAGVTIVDPASTVIDADVTIGEDTDDRALQPAARSHARRPGLHDRAVHDADRRHAGGRRARGALLSAGVRGRAAAAWWARSRTCARGPASHAGAKAGAFVEIKNSEIGPGVKVPHLSYIGDADLGEGTNIGAGTITANYDGAKKHRTQGGQERAHRRAHLPRRSGERRRRRIHWRRFRNYGGHSLGRAWHRAGPPGECRGLRRASAGGRQEGEVQGEGGQGVRQLSSGVPMELLEAEPQLGSAQEPTHTSVPTPYDKRLMVFAGRGSQELGHKIAGKLGHRARPGRAEDLLQRRGVLPLPGVDPRRGRVHRAVDARAGEPQPDGAAADDRRGEGRLRAPDHRRHARGTATPARTRSRCRASRSRPASWRACWRRPAPTAC